MDSAAILHSKRILVIEEQAHVAKVIVHHLEKRGHHVTWVEDGDASWEQLRHKDAWDLILLDLTLPGFDGFEFLRYMTDEKIIPRTPVIVMTEHGDRDEVARAIHAGARDLLAKPFDLHTLTEKVDRHLTPKAPAPAKPDAPVAAAGELPLPAFRLLRIEGPLAKIPPEPLKRLRAYCAADGEKLILDIPRAAALDLRTLTEWLDAIGLKNVRATVLHAPELLHACEKGGLDKKVPLYKSLDEAVEAASRPAAAPAGAEPGPGAAKPPQQAAEG